MVAMLLRLVVLNKMKVAWKTTMVNWLATEMWIFHKLLEGNVVSWPADSVGRFGKPNSSH